MERVRELLRAAQRRLHAHIGSERARRTRVVHTNVGVTQTVRTGKCNELQRGCPSPRERTTRLRDRRGVPAVVSPEIRGFGPTTRLHTVPMHVPVVLTCYVVETPILPTFPRGKRKKNRNKTKKTLRRLAADVQRR